MLCFRQRIWLSGPTFTICSLIFMFVFFFNCVSYYRSSQKYYRLQGYKTMMDDITYTMNKVERIANKSSIFISKIGAVLHKKRHEQSKSTKDNR